MNPIRAIQPRRKNDFCSKSTPKLHSDTSRLLECGPRYFNLYFYSYDYLNLLPLNDNMQNEFNNNM